MKLLLTGAYNYSEEQLNKIKSLGYEITFVKDERVPLEIDVTHIDGVVCNGLFLYNDITKFKNLKFIQLISSGIDRVPLDYIEEKGIQIYNARGVYSVPMAEWVILKILEIYKKSRKFYRNQEEHKWEKYRDLLELTDKRVTIVGFGDVGTEIAKRLRAFGAHVIGVGRREIECELLDEYYMIEDINEVLKKSDIVILTIPLTETTQHLIDFNKIESMKDNSILINVSRGKIVDQIALIEALGSNKFLGVALDVFEEEPLDKDSRLWEFENVIITPHNSFVSDKVKNRMIEVVVENLRQNMNIVF